MARIRTVKPEFFTSEDIVCLSPLARLLYIATWCEADKEGRMVWKPRTFKLRYFPGDDCNIEALCAELTGSGLVVTYGDGLAYIPKFRAHQHINPRESDSSLPDPAQKLTRASRVATRGDASVTVKTRDSDAQGGREGKGKEGVVARDAQELSIPDLVAEGVEEGHATAWVKVRKEKGAPKLSRLAWDAVKREASEVHLSPGEAVKLAAESGWQGFKAAWAIKAGVAKANGNGDDWKREAM